MDPHSTPRSDEFPAGATHWPAELSRRDFVEIMGASLALMTAAGCGRPPLEQIVSDVTPPEKRPSPDFAFYATAMPVEGYARGVLAKAVGGRAIKLEGNPDHPESLGATDAITQASILSLYDPDRSASVRQRGNASAWKALESAWSEQRPGFAAERGAGVALLTEPTTSPTLLREIHAWLDENPAARWYQFTPLARHDRSGVQADFDVAQADVILTLGGDWLYQHPAALRYARHFASRRRVEDGRVKLNRLYVIEPTLTITGAQADVRLPATTARMAAVLDVIAGQADGAALDAAERAFVQDFQARASAGIAICLVGAELPETFHAWGDAFNTRHGGGAARRVNAVRSDADPRSAGGLSDLLDSIARAEVKALWVCGANPAYASPRAADFARALAKVPFTAHLGEYVDETAQACEWHAPEAHYLETWGDLRGFGGVATLQQPLIEALPERRCAAQLVRWLRTGETRSARELVRETWLEKSPADFEPRWHAALDRGVFTEGGTAALAAPLADTAFPKMKAAASAAKFTVAFRADSNVADGRHANNAWLQELPRPFSALVWDNAAIFSAEDARELGVADGDVVTLTAAGVAIAAPVLIAPGQAARCLVLPLGYGRAGPGAVARGRGFDAYPLRPADGGWERSDVEVRRTGRTHSLVTTQQHFTMDGRDLARIVPASAVENHEVGLGEHGRDAHATTESATLYTEWPRDRYAWAMAIDLGTCLGCNACVVACQAENNIPVVGKEQVARGREMHWIRIDRYYSGEPAQPRVLSQPVPCMHCENAPCELVCPVGATVHSSEGLNDMVYNRCVGTRYCSNNCPYKVRRFNFLDFRPPRGSPVYLQANPDVTVRERGVMEKCTYCVQRINAGRIAADKANRRVRDGDIRTACQQVCPTEAIVFGDLNDPQSQVSRRRRARHSYALLAELNTRPRTTYLAKVMADADIPGAPAATMASSTGSRDALVATDSSPAGTAGSVRRQIPEVL